MDKKAMLEKLVAELDGLKKGSETLFHPANARCFLERLIPLHIEVMIVSYWHYVHFPDGGKHGIKEDYGLEYVIPESITDPLASIKEARRYMDSLEAQPDFFSFLLDTPHEWGI
jgi:hypothetical protein